ncbi:putative [ribosomal protein S18]-alanine N-acetyltransferase, partial [Tanacetum coccineum]
KEQYRRQGHGEALVNAAIEKCRSKRINRVSLHVDPLRTSAMQLYKKLGFQIDTLNLACGSLQRLVRQSLVQGTSLNEFNNDWHKERDIRLLKSMRQSSKASTSKQVFLRGLVILLAPQTRHSDSRAIQEKPITQDKVMKWSPGIVALCHLCRKVNDSHDHPFLECKYAVPV